MLPMLYAWQNLSFRRSIALQFIRNDHTRYVVQLFEELTKEALSGMFVASALHQDIQHVAILIHRSPEVMLLASNRENDPRPRYHLSRQRGRRRRSSLA